MSWGGVSMGSAPHPSNPLPGERGRTGAAANVPGGNAAHFCSPGRDSLLGTALRMSCWTAQNRSSAAHSTSGPPISAHSCSLPRRWRRGRPASVVSLMGPAYAGRGRPRKGRMSVERHAHSDRLISTKYCQPERLVLVRQTNLDL